MRLHTHGNINRVKPRWVFLPAFWLSLGLRKEKLAPDGSHISSTFSRVAPAAWVGDSLPGHDPFHPLPHPFVQLLQDAVFLQDAVSAFWHLLCSWEKSAQDNTKGPLVRKPLEGEDALMGQVLGSRLWNALVTSRSCTCYISFPRPRGNFKMWGHSGGHIRLFSKFV